MCAFVLVVEDDDDLGDAMVSALLRAGHTVERVATGAEAVARVAMRPPGVIVLDLGLPDIDGIEVCRRVRAAGYGAGVLVATARTTPDDVMSSLDAGANDFIGKPFTLAELTIRVGELLRAADGRSISTPYRNRVRATT